MYATMSAESITGNKLVLFSNERSVKASLKRQDFRETEKPVTVARVGGQQLRSGGRWGGSVSRKDLEEKWRGGGWREVAGGLGVEAGGWSCPPGRGSCVSPESSEKPVKYFKQGRDTTLTGVCKNSFGCLCVENGLGGTAGKTTRWAFSFPSPLYLGTRKPAPTFSPLGCCL